MADTAYGDPYADPAGLNAFAAGRAAASGGETAPVPRVVGFCLLARRDALDRVGGLEERFGPGNFEDDDLCLRIQASGLRRADRARLVRPPRGQPHVRHREGRLDARDDPQLDGVQGALGPARRRAARGRLRDPARAPRAARALRPAARARRHARDRRRPRLPRGLAARRVQARRRGGRRQRGDRAARRLRRGRALERRPPPLPHAPPPRAGRVRQRHERSVAARRRRRRPRRSRSRTTRASRCCSTSSACSSTACATGARPSGCSRPRSASIRRCPRSTPTSPPRASWRSSRAGAPTATRRLLRTLAARAEAIARRAVPYTTMRISLCMIVKDEEEMLPRCLAAVAEHVDEIVIVDTGSTDSHRRDRRVVRRRRRLVPLERLVRGRPQRLARPRDRRLDPLARRRRGARRRVRASCCASSPSRSWREGFYLRMTSVLGDDDADGGFVHQTMRLFRNRPEYRFVGRIHEQHTGEMPLHLPERFEVVDLHVLHYGYGAERVAAREKGERNRSLLELEAAENANDPFTLFNLGTEHLAAGRPADAAEVLGARLDRRRRAPAGGRRSTCRRSRRGSCRRSASRASRRRRSRRPSRRSPSTPTTPTSSARPRCRPATWASSSGPPRSPSSASSSATPRALRGRDRRRHVPRARPARLDPRRPAALRRGRRAARALARRAPVLHAGPRRARRRRGAARRRAAARGRDRRPARERRGARRGPRAGVPDETLALHAAWRDSAGAARARLRRPRSPRSTGCSSCRSSRRSRASPACGARCRCPSATAASCSPGSTWRAASSTRRPRSGSRSPRPIPRRPRSPASPASRTPAASPTTPACCSTRRSGSIRRSRRRSALREALGVAA